MAVNTVRNNVAYGLNNALQSLSPLPIIAKREPSSSDIGEIGQYWIYNDEVWMFTSASTWTELAAQGNSGTFTELTVNGDSQFNGAIEADTGDEAIVLNTGTGLIDIGTDAFAKTITIGNVTGASALVLNSGTGGVAVASTGSGDITMASSDTLLLDSAGVLELNSSAGVISIGNDAVAQNINVGTGAAARVITIGNVSSTTGLVLRSGTGGIAMSSTSTGDITMASADTLLLDAAGVLELNSSAGAISIGNDAVAQAINIGTGAAARVITIGNVTGATGLVLNSGTGNITISSNSTGNISLVSGKVSSASTTVTNSSFVGTTTITGLTTASAASFTVTMTNTNVATTSSVLVTASNLDASTNGAAVAVTSVVTALNTIIITIKNNGGGSLGTGDDVHIAHMVLN